MVALCAFNFLLLSVFYIISLPAQSILLRLSILLYEDDINLPIASIDKLVCNKAAAFYSVYESGSKILKFCWAALALFAFAFGTLELFTEELSYTRHLNYSPWAKALEQLSLQAVPS